MKSDESHYSTVGIQKERSSSSSTFDISPKAVQQYRKFYDGAIGSYYSNVFLQKDSIFGSHIGVIYGGTVNQNIKSMYQFLRENLDTYPDWKPSNFQNINYYGI